MTRRSSSDCGPKTTFLDAGRIRISREVVVDGTSSISFREKTIPGIVCRRFLVREVHLCCVSFTNLNPVGIMFGHFHFETPGVFFLNTEGAKLILNWSVVAVACKRRCRDRSFLQRSMKLIAANL